MITYVVTAILILLALFLAAVCYFLFSQKTIVRLLRGGLEDTLSFPADYEGRREKVRIEKDLIYPSACGKNELDLYLPAEGTSAVEKDPAGEEKPTGESVSAGEKEHPLLLWVHGGAYVAGDKAGTENWGVMLASEGYAVASMNYEWAPEASYPMQVRQIGEALAYLQEIAPEKQIDMSRVALIGDSAGAHMAAQFAIAQNHAVLSQRLGLASPLEKGALRCALVFCGPYNLSRFAANKDRKLRFFIDRLGWCYLGKRKWQESPLADTLTCKDFVDEHCVPFYITDGNTGSFEAHGKELGEALRASGVEVTERYFPISEGEVGHEYQMRLEEKNAMLCYRDCVKFLKKHLEEA